MYTTIALAALAAVAINAQTPPTGCSDSFAGNFEITAVNSTLLKRDLTKRACGATGSLTLGLVNGKLTDSQGRIGYIASNFQFQFDNPVQAGALTTSGFSACTNGSLALGDTATWWECLSGDFFNLYDRDWAAQCQSILIQMLPCSSTSDPVTQGGDGQPAGTSVGAPPVSQISDGQPQGGTPVPISQISDGQPQVPNGAITQIGDGQPQAPTGVAPGPVSQIGDGQPQAPTGGPAPVSQISDGQPQAPTAPISQISDGQPQAPTGAPAPISQISDGQPQAPTAQPAPISQISDGQPQAPTGQPAPISQISDGQPQAPTGVPAPITQISDGQPQAPTGAPISQISDGQPQAPNATLPVISSTGSQPTSPPFNGASKDVSVGSSVVAMAVGVAAMLFL